MAQQEENPERIWLQYVCVGCGEEWTASYLAGQYKTADDAQKDYSERGCSFCRNGD